MHKIKNPDSWFPVQRGENESYNKYTTLCNLPDIKQTKQKTTINKLNRLERGEREYNYNSPLLCILPDIKQNQKNKTNNKNKPEKEGRTRVLNS